MIATLRGLAEVVVGDMSRSDDEVLCRGRVELGRSDVGLLMGDAGELEGCCKCKVVLICVEQQGEHMSSEDRVYIPRLPSQNMTNCNACCTIANWCRMCFNAGDILAPSSAKPLQLQSRA